MSKNDYAFVRSVVEATQAEVKRVTLSLKVNVISKHDYVPGFSIHVSVLKVC